MKGKIFIDTNIWIYFWLKDITNSIIDKNKFIISFLDSLRTDGNIIYSSLQIFNELSNVLLKKYKLSSEIVKFNIGFMKDLVEITPLLHSDILDAIDIRERYKLSYYDSLMIKTALNSDCDILYSEDLNHNQIFENKLKVVNPFV